ncbi:MAG: metallopeptidase family protein [Myxococcales bacterium]|nr:metallopeptidase family protein [Myxococcales bacterium]
MSRRDRLASLLEKGFTLLEEGDLPAAGRQLELAQKIDPKDPDVVMLDADLAALSGDVERALELYEVVIEARPDDPMPLISAADVYLYSLDEPEPALAAADRALDLVDSEDEILAVTLVRADALIALERMDEARETLQQLPMGVLDDPGTVLHVAEASLAAGDRERASRWIEPMLDDATHGAEAWYLLGAIREDADDRPGMIAAWQEVRRRDAAEPAPPWHLSGDDLERIAQAAFDELPDGVRERLKDVPILIDDLPSEEMVADGLDPRLLGLFQGTPMPEESSVGGAPSVTNIHLFQRNLERMTDDPEELAEEIRITVLHETAHFFGLDDAALDELGLG